MGTHQESRFPPNNKNNNINININNQQAAVLSLFDA